jgi:hypothetical protein
MPEKEYDMSKADEMEAAETTGRYVELLANYHAALAAVAFILLRGGACAFQVLTAVRGAMAAQLELARIEEPADRGTIDAIAWEIERLDGELTALARRHQARVN